MSTIADRIEEIIREHGERIARRMGPKYGRSTVAREFNLSTKAARVLLARIRAEYPGAGATSSGYASPPAAGEPGDGAAFTERYNAATLYLPTLTGEDVVKTEADLMRSHNIDPDAYLVTGREDRAFTTPMKLRKLNEDGSAYDEPVHVQNHVVRLSLVRRTLDRPRFEHLEPVAQARPIRRRAARAVVALERALIVSDPHIGYRRDLRTGALAPFHDRRVLDLAVQLASLEQPEVIVVTGDLMDNAEWSDKFVKAPEFYFVTQPAIHESHFFLAQLRVAAPAARIVLLPGNHDDRWRSAIMRHMIAAYDLRPADNPEAPALLSPQHLLGLDSIDVEYIGEYPEGEVWLNRTTVAMHSATTKDVRAMLRESNANIIRGHDHRIGVAAYTTKYGRRAVTLHGMNPGCACHIDGRVPGSEAGVDWQQGLGLVEYEPGGDAVRMEVLPVQDGRMLWRGEILEGSDAVDGLRAAVDGWAY